MFIVNTLEDVVKQSGILGAGLPSATGWHNIKCKVCNDYRERGGFLFENGAVMYHCFNCGKTAGHKPSSKQFSTPMFEVLTAFGIEMSAARKTLFASFSAPDTPEEIIVRESLQPPPAIELPPSFQFLSTTNPTHTAAIEYVEHRGIEFSKYGLMIASPANPKNAWHNRIIVPVYNRANQVIFFQGRSYTNHPKRWDSPKVPKTNVLFGYHNLDNRDKDYVIVCEGTFDAMSVDGIAVLGSEFSPFHVRTLGQSSKTKIIVPQRDSRGRQMALQALDQGYSLSFPDIGGAQDINDATMQYGRLYVEQQILSKSTNSKYEAQLKLGMWCAS